MAKLHDGLIPEGGTFGPFPGLDPSTDYSDRITITAVDNVGNRTVRSLSELGLELITAEPTPEGDVLSPETQATIDEMAIAKLKPNAANVDGAIVGITTPGGDYYKAYGGDRTASSPLALEDKMRYGSISKIYLNRLVLAQIDAGHISFDDTLDMYVSGGPDWWQRVTIKNLLMMQSGIKDYLQQDPAVQQAYFLNPTSAINAMNYIRSYTTPLYEPGTSASYSNSNTILMGLILEWCDAEFGVGRDIRTIVIEDCLQALGLTESEWPTGNYMTAPYSRGWTPNLALPTIQGMLGPLAFLAGLFGYPTAAEIEWTAVHPSWGGAAGDLDGTIAHLVKFGQSLYAGALLSPEMQQLTEEVFTTYLTYTPANPWEGPGWMGFGLGIIQWGSWLGWIGSLGGYNSTMFYNTQNGAVIAVMMNNFAASSLALFYQIAYELYPESTLIADWMVRPVGIPSGEAFGDMVVVPGGTVALRGIPSAEAFGEMEAFNADAVLTGTEISSTPTVVIPPHEAGDLILLFAMNGSTTSMPATPAAGGTVPAWQVLDIDSSSAVDAKLAWAIAPSNATTSGAWTGAGRTAAVVIRGQGLSPIGGHSVDPGSGTTTVAPAVTMVDTSGRSILLHFIAKLGANSWSTTPAGYTRLQTNQPVIVLRKDDTTSDGAVTQNSNQNQPWVAMSVEVLAWQ